MKAIRKYVGIPTQEEIIDQYNEITELVCEIDNIEKVLNFKKANSNIEIEINNKAIKEYNNEQIKTIRYEYKNILFYANIDNGIISVNPYITLFDDEGAIQFADELYNEYDKEIERVAKMGILENIKKAD